MWKVNKFIELPDEIQDELYIKFKEENESFENFCGVVDDTFGFSNFIQEVADNKYKIIEEGDFINEYVVLTDSYRMSTKGIHHIEYFSLTEVVEEFVTIYLIDEYNALKTVTILESEYNKLIEIKNLYESTSSK